MEYGIVACLLVVPAVGAEFFARRMLAKQYGDGFMKALAPEKINSRYDPQLGWGFVPGATKKDRYGKGLHWSINMQGFRGEREYTKAVPAGKKRVMCIGGSFTFGAGLGDSFAYPPRLERAEPRFEAINMGRGGYGLAQALLLYEREADKYEHDVVVFSFTRDSFQRMIRDSFQTMALKPRFLLDDAGDLELHNVPVPANWRPHWAAAEEDPSPWSHLPQGLALYSVLREKLDRRLVQSKIDRAKLSGAIFDRIKAHTDKHGRKLILIFFPSQADLVQACDTGFCKRTEYPAHADEVRANADRAGVTFIDLSPYFRSLSVKDLDDYYLSNAHFSGKSFDKVVESLLPEIRPLLPALPSSPQDQLDPGVEFSPGKP